MVRRRGSGAGQSRRRWVRSCRWCLQALQEYSFCFILREKMNTMTVTVKSGQFTSGGAGKEQLLWRESGNLSKEIFVRNILSPDSVANMLFLCSDRECWSGVGERVCQFITGESSVTGDPLTNKTYAKGEGVEEDPNIPEGLWLEKRWCLERRADRLKVNRRLKV